MTPKVNQLADFLERVVWTAIQAFAATALVTGFDDWNLTLKISGAAALGAALKVVVAQQFGSSGMGDATPQQVIVPEPK